MIPCELDLTSTTFRDTTIITYEIDLPTSVKKVGFNLMDDEYFTFPYITDTIPNSPSDHQLPAQAKQYVQIVATYREEPITSQCASDKLNIHQTTRGKYKVKISLRRRKSYQRTDIEEICSRFDQVRPVVSHLEFFLPKKPPTPKKIGEVLKVP